MEILSKDISWGSALKIAGTYSVVGVLWILFSDRLVSVVASSESRHIVLQSVKGTGFILFSSLLIFFLVGRTLHEITSKTTELEAALQQADRLHRILRHNLRNSCQVIGGNSELLVEQIDDEEEELIATIQEQNQRLISLSRKSVYLRDFLDLNQDHRTTEDLVASVRTQVERARENYPNATITVDCPAHAQVKSHKYIGEAVEELIDNAIRHNDSPNPSVWVEIQKEDEMVSLTVTDNGPGIPRVERLVLERKTETQTEHSQGLGLWLIYLTVNYSNGTLTVANRDEGGAEIQFKVPSA